MALQFREAYVRDGVKRFATTTGGKRRREGEKKRERTRNVLLKIVAAIRARDHIFDSAHGRHLTFTTRRIHVATVWSSRLRRRFALIFHKTADFHAGSLTAAVQDNGRGIAFAAIFFQV